MPGLFDLFDKRPTHDDALPTDTLVALGEI
jgi:hypothetical protein